jgi:CheY-like chemotaxis protein
MTVCDFYSLATNRGSFPGSRAGRSWSSDSDGKYMARVLVVDDEELIAESVAEILRTEGFDAIAAFSGHEAMEVTRELCPDIVLTDVLMPDMDGVETAIRIREACPKTRILLFSGQAATSDLLERAKSKGHQFELLPKPLHPTRLIAAINRVM